MLYKKRNIDLLVSHFALKRNLVTGKSCPGNCDYMVNFQPTASRDPGIAMPGSQPAGLRLFHVIAKLIFSVFHGLAEILAKRASPPHVMGPLVLRKTDGRVSRLWTIRASGMVGTHDSNDDDKNDDNDGSND